jgi:UDP-2,4-diacetamido-2,4,6-trideoxy-beta-L-altropyranose hydrolase
MKIVFRTDASNKIGTGHFMRCLSLAEECKKFGAQVDFICSNLPPYFAQLLQKNKIKLLALEKTESCGFNDQLPHSAWLEGGQKLDANASIHVIGEERYDWLVVDHYALDHRWEESLRPYAKKIMVIDDLADRLHNCDLLLDQNLYSNLKVRYIDKVPADCRLLLGPKYALLREEFKISRNGMKVRTGELRNVLIFFGGIDLDNYTCDAINALATSGLNLRVDVVIGIHHPCKNQILRLCEEYDYFCHVQTTNMAELIANADLAIGCGGGAIWERCCLGLPAITFCAAENQRNQIDIAAEIGILFAPKTPCSLIEVIGSHLLALIDNPRLVKLISSNASKIVDGEGVIRVVESIRAISNLNSDNSQIHLREAQTSDVKKIWPWRNHENTRRFIFNKSEVDIKTHIEWWERALNDPGCILMLGSIGGNDFGVIRFNFNDKKKVTVSIYLDPEMVGLGLGSALLASAINWLFKNYSDVKVILAEVVSQNLQSIKMFKSLGFQERNRVLVLTR